MRIKDGRWQMAQGLTAKQALQVGRIGMGLMAAGLAGLVILLSGCGALIPREHTEQAAVKTAGELSATHDDQMTKRSAIPEMKIGGWGNTVKIQAPAKGAGAAYESVTSTKGTLESAGSDSASGKAWSKFPWWVGLIAGVLGIAGLVLLIKWMRRSSAGVNAAFNLADREMAGLIGKLEAQLHAASDPTHKVTLLSALNDANKARGKVASAAPAQVQ